jgi:nucleoside diphosphate kinase
MNTEIIKAFEEVTQGGKSHVWVRPFHPLEKQGLHQFIFFLKPEATAAHEGVNVPAVLDLATKTLQDAGIEIGAVRVLSGDYLDRYGIMGEHYGVISAISRSGVAAISDAAKAKLNEVFKASLEAGAEVLGGHQFLAKEKNFNPFSLLVLNDNLGTTRLAGGTYAMHIKILGKPVIILNPFHAYQLVPYTTHGHAIIVMEGLSSMSWADLRQKIAGVTDPKDAVEGSIRNLFLRKKHELGLKDVDKGTNGVHMSAGPLEGMVELARFFTDHEAGTPVTYDKTNFGAALMGKNLSIERVNSLAGNPDFEEGGKKVSAFDLTEEKDAAASADLLAGKASAAL